MQRHDRYAPLRLPAFRRYVSGHMILILGQQAQKVAIGWEIYERTGSALHLGYAGLVQFLPLVLLAVPSGHVADNYNRKTVLMISLALTALAGGGLVLNTMYFGSAPALYGLLLITAAAKAFQISSKAALVVHTVPREIFSNAVSWNSSGFELASMAGPAIGGLMIGFFRGAGAVYLLSAVSPLVFFVMLLGVPYAHQLTEKNPLTLRSLLAGLTFVWRTKAVLAAMTLDMFGVLLGGATTLMPIFAKDILRVGPRGLGWLLAAPSVGAFAMAMFQAHRPPYRRPGDVLLLTVAGFGAATVLFGLSRSFYLSLAMLFLLGIFDNVSVVIRNTLIQLLTPDEMRGRVSALNGVFIGTSNELGGFESGLVAGFFGPVLSVVSGGFGTLLVVLAVWQAWPELRKYSLRS